jgi:hypothetical protein
MMVSKTSSGCAVILLLLLSSASALTLTHEDAPAANPYTSDQFVKGHTQVLNACFKEIPEDKTTLFEWVKGSPNTLIITSCSNEPAKLVKRSCSYTLDPQLTAEGAAFKLGACTVTQNGAGCVDHAPDYISRINQATKLELLSDRFNFRDATKKIHLVTQNKH